MMPRAAGVATYQELEGESYNISARLTASEEKERDVNVKVALNLSPSFINTVDSDIMNHAHLLLDKAD